MEKLKNYIIKLWHALWAQTDFDERVEAALKEAKENAEASLADAQSRIQEIKKELADVKRAAKEVVSQSKDIVGAAKGKKRKGRKAKK